MASGINTVAGGGSLISFPMLTLMYGIPSIQANTTNAVALWPGSLSGAIGYLNYIKKTKRYLRLMLLPTLGGSLLGAYLLVQTTTKSFNEVVPWLILLAALLLVFQPKIKAWAESQGHVVSPTAGVVVQFLVSTYGGYFGAGMGIMMLGAFALTMEGDIHELNAVKNWLGVLINLVASVYFIYSKLVLFNVALLLVIGSIIGGYASARISQRVPAEKLRIAIAVYGIGMSAFFLARAFGI